MTDLDGIIKIQFQKNTEYRDVFTIRILTQDDNKFKD